MYIALRRFKHIAALSRTIWSTLYAQPVEKYPARYGFEPGTSRWHASIDTNEPSGPDAR